MEEVKVEITAQDVSDEMLKEFQSLADKLLKQGYEKHAMIAYMAQRYRCPVSQTFGKDNTVVLHLDTRMLKDR